MALQNTCSNITYDFRADQHQVVNVGHNIPYNCNLRPSRSMFKPIVRFLLNLAHLSLWHREGMRICPLNRELINVFAIPSECQHTPGSSPSHRKRPKIRNTQCFSDMVSSHSAGALYQDVRALTCIPRVLKKVIQPTPKLSNMLALMFPAQNGETDLQKALLQERDRECAILDTYSHEFCWIATNVPEFNPMLSIESKWCF